MKMRAAGREGEIYKLVMAGGRAYALGMKPYLRVLGAYAQSQPSTV